MELIEDTQLMKQSKADLVAALNAVGVEASVSTPLSEIAELIKWAGGLRDITLACISKADGKQAFFTREQWGALSVSTQSGYVRIGLRIRAERQQFILAKEDARDPSTGNLGLRWTESFTNVPGLKDYYGDPAVFGDIDAEGNTDKILAFVEESGIKHPAAQAARAYKASTIADGAYNDPTTWSLPAFGQLFFFYKYRLEIDAELEFFFGPSGKLSGDWYWSSTEGTANEAWNVYTSSGYASSSYKLGGSRVRPVAPVSLPAI